ncbi:MAG: bifunctional oligoribonuclease/PAP phosphatase NrnA [Patescibacteria group bacterium]
MKSLVKEMAPVILEAIKKSDSILLHCHPSPDPDSVGSVLAMKSVLEGMGKRITAIRGHSSIPKAFSHFPGVQNIFDKSFEEINLKDFDLFIILDSGSPNMISRGNPPVFPLEIKTIVIDHHMSNEKYGEINLVDPTYPATAQILFDLFKEWEVELTRDVSINLFMGMYTDTGGFRYHGTTAATLIAASELASKAPDFNQFILQMEQSHRKEAILYEGLALSSMKTFCEDKLAISSVSFEAISKNEITSEDISGIPVANILISASMVQIGISIAEEKSGELRVQFRSKDAENFDVSKLAIIFGGGGHKMASGARVKSTPEETIEKIVKTAKLIYNL